MDLKLKRLAMVTKQFKLQRSVKLIITSFIVVHLLAIVLPPLSFQARGRSGVSPFIGRLVAPIEAYCQFLYLNRGYAFFAPDPGPSHLIQVRVQDAEGHDEEMFYPDVNRQWPRLLYHRYFMLTEYLNEVYRPRIESASEYSEEELWVLRNEREKYDLIRNSYSLHLQSVHGGKQVSLRRIEHLLPRYDLYRQAPRPLNDSTSYRVLLDSTRVDVNKNDVTTRLNRDEPLPGTSDFELTDVQGRLPRNAK